MSDLRVLVSDKMSSNVVDILAREGLKVDVITGKSPEELAKIIGDYHGLVVRSSTKVTPELLVHARNLKVVGRAGSGLDNVDLPESTKRGIVVMNTPGGNTITTAEHAFSLLCSMARYIPQATQSLREGRWEKNKYMGVELYGKTLGVVGAGQIGSHVITLAQGFGMHVLAYDPFLSPERAERQGIGLATLEQLYEHSDFITLHTPLTNETHNLINKDTISRMKDGVRIVNCARGGLVNEDDLVQALKSGKVAGAAFDVFEKEPVDPKHPLLGLENFICSPHLGASTHEAQENVAVAVAEQIADYLVRGVIRNAVNFPSISPELAPQLTPFITLAEKLGGALGQVYEGGLEKVAVKYRGKVTDLNVAPVTIAAIKGLLAPILGDTVNHVNALVIAKDRGIEVVEVKEADISAPASTITITAHAGGKSSRVIGLLTSTQEPRIVELNDIQVEVVPTGYMLILSNRDVPGVIGAIGTVLGDNRINIALMNFGRDTPGGRAIAVVNVDEKVPDSVLDKLRAVPNILTVKQIYL
ncbi:MAG: phosphoglycerate dehydrogenase [Nitrospirota bacterium]|nr:phosphoglycerate dehydrogenase [Nitrospirota bacterium]